MWLTLSIVVYSIFVVVFLMEVANGHLVDTIELKWFSFFYVERGFQWIGWTNADFDILPTLLIKYETILFTAELLCMPTYKCKSNECHALTGRN